MQSKDDLEVRKAANSGSISINSTEGVNVLENIPETPVDGELNAIERKINHEEELKMIDEALNTLPKNQKIVISRLFKDNKNLADVSSELNLTEGRISQLKKLGLEKMRKVMAVA